MGQPANPQCVAHPTCFQCFDRVCSLDLRFGRGDVLSDSGAAAKAQTGRLFVSLTSARYARSSDYSVHEYRVPVHHHRHCGGDCLGFRGAGRTVGGGPAHRLFPVYLGFLPGYDLPPCLRRVARETPRVACSGRFRLRYCHLGYTPRPEERAAAMKLALAGINHRTAPVELRERVAFRSDELPHALELLHQHTGQPEALILSTCNRVEVTTALEDDVDAAATLGSFLATSHHVAPEILQPHLYLFEEADAIRHLFRVAASLDSMVVGEPQILGQLKQA